MNKKENTLSHLNEVTLPHSIFLQASFHSINADKALTVDRIFLGDLYGKKMPPGQDIPVVLNGQGQGLAATAEAHDLPANEAQQTQRTFSISPRC